MIKKMNIFSIFILNNDQEKKNIIRIMFDNMNQVGAVKGIKEKVNKGPTG